MELSLQSEVKIKEIFGHDVTWEMLRSPKFFIQAGELLLKFYEGIHKQGFLFDVERLKNIDDINRDDLLHIVYPLLKRSIYIAQKCKDINKKEAFNYRNNIAPFDTDTSNRFLAELEQKIENAILLYRDGIDEIRFGRSKKEMAATQEHAVALNAEKVKETANAVTDGATTVEEECLIIHHYVGKGVSIEYYTDEKGRFFKFTYYHGALLDTIYMYENKEAVCNPQLLRGIPLQQKPDTKAMKKVNARHF